MSEFIRLLILLISGAALAVFLLVCYSIGADWQDQRIKDAACQEDDPCWDCSTMGNGICGPVEER